MANPHGELRCGTAGHLAAASSGSEQQRHDKVNDD
jgi:hypothetical protein